MHHQNREIPILNDEFVAQQVEHNTFNVGVLGSSPSEFTQTTTFSGGCFVLCSIIEHWLECLPYIQLRRSRHNISLTHCLLKPDALQSAHYSFLYPTFATVSEIKFCFFDLYRVSLHDCLHVRKRTQNCRPPKMYRD